MDLFLFPTNHTIIITLVRPTFYARKRGTAFLLTVNKLVCGFDRSNNKQPITEKFDMISINLAFDEEIAHDLKDYLTNLGIDSKLKRNEVLITKDDFDQGILKSFLKKTKRTEYKIKKINTESFLISKEIGVENFGLGTCEICGLVDFEEKLFSHRWTHGL